MADNHLKIGKKLFIDPVGWKNILIVFAGILVAFNQVINIVMPGAIINTLYPEQDIQRTTTLVCVYAAAMLSIPFLIDVLNRRLGYLNLWVNDKIREKLLRMQLRTDLLKLENPDYANDMDFGTKCLGRSFYLKFSNLLISLVSLVFVLVGSICVIHEGKSVVGFIVSCIFLLPFYFIFQSKINQNSFEEQLNNNAERREMEAVQWNMLDLQYSQEIRCFNLMNFMTGKYNACREFVYGERKRNCKKNALLAIVPSVLFGIQMLVSYMLAGYSLINGKISVGDFLIYAEAFWGIASGFRDLVEKLVMIKTESLYLGALAKCFTYDAEEQNGSLSVEAFHSIEFKDVFFSYSGDDNYAIHDLNVTIREGDKLALVGENGSGKSTFIKLLLGLYKPTKGTVLLNGKDMSLYSRKQVKDIFAPVFQDYAVTSYTIEENIAFSNQIDEKKMQDSLEQAGIYEKVSSLPKGVKTNVFFKLSNEGTELSGGELQKLAMSRVYYKDAPVFILDEPAAALSPKAELDLYNKVWSLAKDKTVILISHRLSSCCEAERILVFKLGNVEETGNHTELMDAAGYYSTLFLTQAENYR